MQVERAISKSKFISGLQCHKLVWHQYNAKELIPPVDESQQAVFDQGHEVGRRARQLYPGGVLVERERWDMDGLVEDTARAISLGGPLRQAQGGAIYEAAFLGGGVYAQVDILVPAGDGRWDSVEVKSSTSVKSVYLGRSRHAGDGQDSGRAGGALKPSHSRLKNSASYVRRATSPVPQFPSSPVPQVPGRDGRCPLRFQLIIRACMCR